MFPIAPNRKPIVLIVDDTPMNIEILSKILSKEYEIKIATRGEKALEIARSQVPPDLILLDIMMPGMDGYEVCVQLKGNPDTAEIPVIFVTAKSNVEDETKGFSVGAVDYITKPFHFPIVQARIQTHLRLSRQSRLLEEYAFIDSLTHIPNRRRFDAVYEEEWRRALRNTTPLCLCMIDIDYFKKYNDTLGHGEGDVCLQKVAAAIVNSSARGGELAARYGGEEFIVLLPHCDEATLAQSAENIRRAVEALHIAHPASEVSSVVTVSIGCAITNPSDRALDRDGLLKRADNALYAAKNGGRNRTAIG
ncbi:MAG: diguanylate cyclase [Sulfuricurvum sp.]|jgi:diguanylate cyclase (GGDEF)-like protein|uniref:diguanylate cyclase domain-containing protein n=1 Tax=Sulfuricurvum sp. TaxID=2025608 RepID=UPI0025E58083|nr:diguanylate cyclase [Sulfuricurvum sp.]MCK9372198.1 diguanylate cyclase [Sulfuricurvum sp.]